MSNSSITIDDDEVVEILPPLHPGEMLREEFMAPLGLTPYALAKALHVPRTRIERLVREEVLITPDTALRLGRYFGMTPESWLNLNRQYQLDVVRRAAPGAYDDIVPSPHLKTAAE